MHLAVLETDLSGGWLVVNNKACITSLLLFSGIGCHSLMQSLLWDFKVCRRLPEFIYTNTESEARIYSILLRPVVFPFSEYNVYAEYCFSGLPCWLHEF